MSIEQTPLLAFGNCICTCRSRATRVTYQRSLHYFIDYLKIDRNEYEKLLTIDPKLIQMNNCNFVLSLRKDHSSFVISVYVTAINKFYAYE
jgi:hypothetical protein